MTRDAEHTPSPQSVVVPVEPTFTPIDYLRLIAEGYEVIEATGSQMTIQSPDDEGPQELVIDVDALAAAPAPSSLAGWSLISDLKVLSDCDDMEVSHSHGDTNIGDVARRCLAALSPEAPAREGGVPLDTLADWLVMRERQSTDGAQQHIEKAPAKHFCAGKASAFREVASVLWNSPEWFALTPRHEAPAEGAGGDGPIDRMLADADSRLKRKDPDINGARVCLHGARLALRARSSAPEAREGAIREILRKQAADPRRYLNPTHAVSDNVFVDHDPEARFVADDYSDTHPAAPSADTLRIAVEALRLTKSRIQTWPIDDQETCMCGSPVSGHGMGDGHSPVSQGDHAVSMLVEEIDQALAALKAEGA